MADTKAAAALTAGNEGSTEPSVEECVEKAKRALALKKYEQAVDHYATALEIMAAKFGDGAPEAADLYFAYGKALLENAISQTAVLGKEQADEEDEANEAALNPFISFSGDAEEDNATAPGGDDVAVDLFAEANAAIEDEEKEDDEEEGEEDADGEPEDDFNAAWEVLDLARALFEKRKEEDDDIKLKLADTYIALGDVSLETEKFDLAISDYEAGAALKTELLPLSSRQVAEAHYKLSIVLDLTSGRLAQAIEHAEKALDSVEARLAELRNGLSGQLPPLPNQTKSDAKGKGKASGTILAQDELVQKMSKIQIEAEIKELGELREDLALKVDELKTSPNGDPPTNAPELVAKALDRELNPGSSNPGNPSASVVVNDLTTMVKKKKKPVNANVAPETNGKRKAEDDTPSDSKKAKVEDSAAIS
ncbi:hypothetical protein DFH11DRAFT_706912 [Phellopilus nigrolimitatus]|nr:hypothetical protein DFH11DRAFT_706912 [Phellopilus nigrolimitatus]